MKIHFLNSDDGYCLCGLPATIVSGWTNDKIRVNCKNCLKKLRELKNGGEK